MDVEILRGDEEARLSYEGALSGVEPASRPAAVIDIGGGSTEVSYPASDPSSPGESSLKHHSFQLGAVRLTERCFNHNPPTNEELLAAREMVQKGWESIDALGAGDYSLIGVAGTITTLACLDQGLTEFDASRVAGYKLPREHVEQWFGGLSRMGTAGIEAHPCRRVPHTPGIHDPLSFSGNYCQRTGFTVRIGNPGVGKATKTIGRDPSVAALPQDDNPAAPSG